MALSLRLDEQTAQQLEDLAREKGLSKSELVRQCLAEYLSQQQQRLSPWELGKDLFGRAASGRGDLSRKAEQIVQEKIVQEKMRAKRGGH